MGPIYILYQMFVYYDLSWTFIFSFYPSYTGYRIANKRTKLRKKFLIVQDDRASEVFDKLYSLKSSNITFGYARVILPV